MFCNTLRAAGGAQDITPVQFSWHWAGKVLLALPGSAAGDTPALHSATSAGHGDVPGQGRPAAGRGNSGGVKGIPERTSLRTHAHGTLDAQASPGTLGTTANKVPVPGHGPKPGALAGTPGFSLPRSHGRPARTAPRPPAGRGTVLPSGPGRCCGALRPLPGRDGPGGAGAGAGGGGVSPAGWAGRAHVAWRGAGTGTAGPARERRCPAPARHTARRGTAGSLLPTAGAEPRPERQPRRPPP